MKLELVQLAARDGDTAHNLQRILKAIATCAPDTDLVVFHESQITGFLDAGNIAANAEPLDGPSVRAIAQAARDHEVAVVVAG